MKLVRHLKRVLQRVINVEKDPTEVKIVSVPSAQSVITKMAKEK